MATLLQQLENVLGSWDRAVGESHNVPPPLPPPPAPAVIAPHAAHGVDSIPLTLLSTAEDLTEAASSGQPHSVAQEEESRTTDVHDTRRALSRIELARAALALFASNAGIYRPVLQKVLSFLFRYVDYLVDERAQRRLSRTALDHDEVAEKMNGLDEHGNMSTTPAEAAANDEVARAYQKIRLVEAKMQILVEEASAQRDRFRAQITAHEQQEAKLTLLLQHQMELTDALLLHPAAESTLARVRAAAAATSGNNNNNGNVLPHREMSGGGVDVYHNAARGPPLVRDPAHVRRLITRAAKEKALEELELEVRRLNIEREANQQKITDLLKLNSQYARQAVELAARLSIIRDHNVALATDAQLYQRDAMQEQQRADKLARELLTARGILLAATEARSRELQLLSAEHGSLTGLHPGRKNPAVLLAARATSATSVALSNTTTSAAALPIMERSQTAVWAGGSAGSPLRAAGQNETSTGVVDESAMQPLPSALVQHAVPNTATPPQQRPPATMGDVTEMVESMVLSVQDNTLRHQLQHILSMQDVESPGAVKAALLALINLHGGLPFGSCTAEARGPAPLSSNNDNNSSSGAAGNDATGQVITGSEQDVGAAVAAQTSGLPLRAKLQLYELRGHRWTYPRGCHGRVPRHLRSAFCVSFYDFHPVVAECLVYELLSQRRRFLESGAFEDELNRSMAGAFLTSTGATMGTSMALQSLGASRGLGKPFTNTGSSALSMPSALRAFVPLDEFVELFVGIVWLNRGERLVRLLPEKARRQLSEYIDTKQRTSRQGHALFSSLTGRSSPAMTTSDAQQTRQESQNASFAGGSSGNSKTAPPQAQLQLSFNVHLQRMLHSMQLPEEMLRLSEEGLKLTYGIDVLSRSPQAGFLTYAFGVVSRNEVSEVLFEVMRSERAVLLAMCAAVEKERLQRRRQRNLKTSPRTVALHDDDDEDNGGAEAEVEEVKLQGCIPTVQLARILIAMFPTYPIARIEQLCIAAAEDATDSTENPVMVYYTVLLPLQQLPGAALISQSSPTTNFAAPSFVAPSSPVAQEESESEQLRTSPFRRSGAFATLFYKSICDDALESLQMIEDSITSFAENRACAAHGTSNAGGGGAAEGSSGGGGAAVVTAVTSEQLTTVALQELPVNELQQWGPALRGTLLRWALRFYGNASLVDVVAPSTATTTTGKPATPSPPPPRGASPEATKEGEARDNATQLLPEELEACLTATQIPLSEVMPYLRRNLVPRRGPHPLPLSALVSSVPVPPPLSPKRAQQGNASSSAEVKRGSDDAEALRRPSESAVSPLLFPAVSAIHIEPGRASLTARHEQEVRQKQEIKRAEVRVRRWSAEQAAYLQLLQHRWSAYAPANEPMPVELEEFMALLHVHDPRRGELWASEECGRNNHFLRTSERAATFAPGLLWANATQRPGSSDTTRKKSGSARRKSFRDGRRKSRRGSMASVKSLAAAEESMDSGGRRGKRSERASTTSGRLPVTPANESATALPKPPTKERKSQTRSTRSAMLPQKSSPPDASVQDSHDGDNDVQ